MARDAASLEAARAGGHTGDSTCHLTGTSTALAQVDNEVLGAPPWLYADAWRPGLSALH